MKIFKEEEVTDVSTNLKKMVLFLPEPPSLPQCSHNYSTWIILEGIDGQNTIFSYKSRKKIQDCNIDGLLIDISVVVIV